MAASAPVLVAPGVVAVGVRASTVFLHLGASVTIVDAGARGSARQVLAALRAVGRSPSEVGCIVISHAHLDHVGGLSELQRLFDAPTAAHRADAPAITSQEPLPNPFRHRAAAAASAAVLRRLDPGPAAVDIALEDGDAVPGTDLRVFHMPGHTPGSIALIAGAAVLAGDALEVRRGRPAQPNRFFTGDMAEARASIARLAGLNFETLCLSHFAPITGDASRAVRALVAMWED